MRIIISNSSNEPIYMQIVNQLKELILKDELKAGYALPSIRNLARELQVRYNNQRAYEELEREGLLKQFKEKALCGCSQQGNAKRKEIIHCRRKTREAVLFAKSWGFPWMS